MTLSTSTETKSSASKTAEYNYKVHVYSHLVLEDDDGSLDDLSFSGSVEFSHRQLLSAEKAIKIAGKKDEELWKEDKNIVTSAEGRFCVKVEHKGRMAELTPFLSLNADGKTQVLYPVLSSLSPFDFYEESFPVENKIKTSVR